MSEGNENGGNVPEQQRLLELAARPENKQPPGVRDDAWRKARMAAGHLVIIRSHFKSIYLIPLAIFSIVCGVAVSMGDGGANEGWTRGWGLAWMVAFMFYLNIFIFEWNRAWTVVLFGGIVSVVCIGFAVNSESFPVWSNTWEWINNLDLQVSNDAYFVLGVFFALCSGISYLKTRMHYVVMEHNEIQEYRNAFFGDRQRFSMMNPTIEVLVPDMVEYFHPFYRSGTVVIHASTKTLVLENVLGIRKIERITDRLGSTLSVRVERDNAGPAN